jgi:glycine/D-amino acid oxidase-like deaminating enzyme
LTNVGRVGKEDAVKIARLEYDCIVAVHDFARTHNIDCDSRRLDTVDVIYDEEQWANAKETVALMEELMGKDDPAARYEFYDSAETASRFLTPGAVGSISYEAGSLSAYRLTIGILKLALEKGLKLHCNTPVQMAGRVCHEEQFDHWVLATPRGLITTQKVIHATNGYMAHLMTSLQGVIVPLRGIVTAQRPGKSMPANGLDHTYSFIYKNGYEYMIPRPKGTKFDGDIIIGGGLTKTANDGIGEYGNTDDTSLNDDIIDYLNGSTETIFGENWGEDDPEGRIRMAWSGIMGYSADGHPLVGKMPQSGLYIAASFQGHGMVNCFLCAKALVAMLLDKDDEKLDRWFPRAYRMSEKRLESKFRSKLHATETAKTWQPNRVGGGTSH